MKINIETIPHESQRYETVGDYWYDEQGVLQIRVSDMGNTKYERMVVIHELIEQSLTEWAGITEEQIMEFDLKFEEKREEENVDEPGFDNNAPYLVQHTFATSVELGMCALAGISWTDYDNTVINL